MDRVGEATELTRVQCGACAWMSAAHESVAEAYLEVGAHFVNVHRYAATAAPSEPAPPTRPQDGKQCGACSRGDHADCSGWCFCPKGPCDEAPAAAPPTVAPAMDVVFAMLPRGQWEELDSLVGHEWVEAICEAAASAIERDRASRSPGATAAYDNEFRCDWKSWCVRLNCHDGDCEPLAPSRLYEPATPLDSARALAVHCARCRASASVRCVGSVNEPWRFHFARFVLASAAPKDEPQPVPSALRGLEGRLRPGSEATGKVQGAPLSGLDAATVEARLLLRVRNRICEVASSLGFCGFCTMVCRLGHDCDFEDGRYCLEEHGDECLSQELTRALATPPGQAKP